MPYWLGVWLPISQQDVSHEFPSRWVLVLASPTLVTNPFFFQLKPWLAIAGIALAITVLCWLPMIAGLTRSIKQMMSATARIAEGHFDVQVGAGRKDELGYLGASINRMAERLDTFAQGRTRFLGDVATSCGLHWGGCRQPGDTGTQQFLRGRSGRRHSGR